MGFVKLSPIYELSYDMATNNEPPMISMVKKLMTVAIKLITIDWINFVFRMAIIMNINSSHDMTIDAKSSFMNLSIGMFTMAPNMLTARHAPKLLFSAPHFCADHIIMTVVITITIAIITITSSKPICPSLILVV